MNALDHKCPSCGAPITFHPKEQCWKCDYCGNQFSLEEMKKYNNASNETVNEPVKTEQVDSYHCKNCGAVIIADEYTTATFCVYCGSTAILKEKIQNNRLPDFIIPFTKEKEDAVKAFQKLSKTKPLMPKIFNDKNNIEKLKGVYIPFWTFDIQSKGEVILSGNQKKFWSTGDREYIKTDVYDILQEGELNFTHVPVDASTRFDDAMMNAIEPFDYTGLTKYNHAYLSGFLAEKYDVEKEKAYEIALNRVMKSSEDTFKRKCGSFSSVAIQQNDLNYKEMRVHYILLPVWMIHVKYNRKMYLFAMNGQTGELIGNIPLDKKKTILYFILIFAGILFLVVWISFLLFEYGGW